MNPVDSSYDTSGYPSTDVGDDKELYKLTVRYVPVDIADRKTEGYVYDSGIQILMASRALQHHLMGHTR